MFVPTIHFHWPVELKFKSCKVVANNNYGQRSAVLLRLDAEKDMNLTGPGSLAHKTDLGRF